MTLLLPTDGCPQCVTARPVHPWVVLKHDTSMTAWYVCPACRHEWSCNWALSALDLPCPGCKDCPEPSERRTA